MADKMNHAIPAAGWYADPSGEHELRYFDGARWTEHVFSQGQQGTAAVTLTARHEESRRLNSNGATPEQMTLPSVQPAPVTLASIGQRWVAAVLDNLVFWFTLGIGWLIWLWFTSAEGQTPGKKVLGLRVIQQDTGKLLVRGEAFGRGVLKTIFDLVSMFLFYIPMFIAAGMLFSDPLRRAPWDRMLKTLVVHDPSGKTIHEAARISLPVRV